MAKKQEIRRIYSLPDADLEQLGDRCVTLIDRDNAELAGYGVGAADRTFVVNKTKELKNFPTDEELEGNVSEKTEIKDTAAAEVKTSVRSIMVRVKNKFGENSVKFHKFGVKDMASQDDNSLHRLGKRVSRVAAGYLSDLASEGLTQAILDDLDAKNATFDDTIDAKDDAVRDRDISTDDRVRHGNELYTRILRIFDAGKDYWASKNQAKYNDYVILETSPAEEKKSLQEEKTEE